MEKTNVKPKIDPGSQFPSHLRYRELELTGKSETVQRERGHVLTVLQREESCLGWGWEALSTYCPLGTEPLGV